MAIIVHFSHFWLFWCGANFGFSASTLKNSITFHFFGCHAQNQTFQQMASGAANSVQ